ncbi:hypothetical protein CRUP_030224 [Coryphaenoides rupestris]|nr:hypothetical protein CRUP_030224 [Coryphaenoides rupestris]
MMNAVMAESGFPLPPDPYRCALCLDDPRDPVSLPCGDTCCLECVKIYWDQLDHVGVYSCPQCRATFTPRPVLRRNLPNVHGQGHGHGHGHGPRHQEEQSRNPPALTPFPHLHRDVLCDFCVGPRNKAVKSCLVCLAYYCETHVKPHYESATFKRHKLVDETGHLDRKICPQHEKGLELFCRTDQMCICVLCTVREHRGHNIISAEEDRTDKQKVLVGTQSEVQYIIQDRMKELQELRHNVDRLKITNNDKVTFERKSVPSPSPPCLQSCAQRAQTDSDKSFHEMQQAVDRWHDEVRQLIQANMQAAMAQAEGYVERLENEIAELQRRDAELRQILETEDNIHFLQVLINPQFAFEEIEQDGGGHEGSSGRHLQDGARQDLQDRSWFCPDGNQRVTRRKAGQQPHPDHPDRFDGFSQVLVSRGAVRLPPSTGRRSGPASSPWAWPTGASAARARTPTAPAGLYNDRFLEPDLLGHGLPGVARPAGPGACPPRPPRARRAPACFVGLRGPTAWPYYSVARDTMSLLHRFKANSLRGAVCRPSAVGSSVSSGAPEAPPLTLLMGGRESDVRRYNPS